MICMNYANFHYLEEMRTKNKFPNGELFSTGMHWKRTFQNGLEMEQFIFQWNKLDLCLPEENLNKCSTKALS